MKRNKILLIGLVVVAFVLFFTMRPVREKACPLTKANLANDPLFATKCAELGKVMKNGECTCPE